MKKLDSITTVLLFGLGLFSLMAFTTYRASIKPLEQLKTEPIVKLLVKPLIIDSVELELTSHQQFLDAMGHRESSNNYKAVNKYGYMGKYQFGRSTLKTLKINVSRSEFINNPKLQEQAMYKLLQYNKNKLKRYIEKYNGRVINGVLVTESGLLAAAHLGGAGSVRKWFRTGKVRRDGNGVKITSYMKLFRGYDLNL
jgi:hypothetical protein|tara:strand:- start:34 stop:624 length:591 start_codon:yes stop_codon:yes gene_type:complete